MLYVTTRPNLQTPLRFDYSDKIAHFVEYAMLGLLSRMAAGGLSGAVRRRPALVAAAVVAFGLLVGALDETIQRSVPGRQSSWTDFVADAIGVAAGLAFAGWAAGRWRRSRGAQRGPRPMERGGR